MVFFTAPPPCRQRYVVAPVDHHRVVGIIEEFFLDSTVVQSEFARPGSVVVIHDCGLVQRTTVDAVVEAVRGVRDGTTVNYFFAEIDEGIEEL